VPIRVRLFDQLDLPLPWPALQRLLSPDRVAHVEVLFVPDEPRDGVTRCEARPASCLVLGHAAGEVVRETNVDGATLLAGGHVDIAGHAPTVADARPSVIRPGPPRVVRRS